MQSFIHFLLLFFQVLAICSCGLEADKYYSMITPYVYTNYGPVSLTCIHFTLLQQIKCSHIYLHLFDQDMLCDKLVWMEIHGMVKQLILLSVLNFHEHLFVDAIHHLALQPTSTFKGLLNQLTWYSGEMNVQNFTIL